MNPLLQSLEADIASLQAGQVLAISIHSITTYKTDYDIAPIWFGDEMARLRRSIANKDCSCPLANASYANMLLHPPTLAKAALDVVR